MSGLLAGYTVLEIGAGIATGYCGRLLAGYGATVLKVEPPAGDLARRMRVVPGADVPDPEAAPMFAYLGMGKRSVIADLDSPADADFLRGLAVRADVLVVDRPSPAMEALGLGYTALSAVNPALVYTTLTGFGDSGPRRDWKAENITVAGLGGQMSLTGEPDREPLCPGGEQGWLQLGLQGFAATAFALLGRSETGLGQQVDLSAVEVMAGALEGFGPSGRFGGLATPRSGKARFALMGIYPCRDGYAGIFCTPGQVPLFAQVADWPELAADPRAQSVLGLVMASEEFAPRTMAWLAAHTKEEIRVAGRESGMTIAPVYSIADVAASPHLRERGFFVKLPLPGGGTVEVPGAPAALSRTPWESRPAPPLGELSQPEAMALLAGERRRVVPRTLRTPEPALAPPPTNLPAAVFPGGTPRALPRDRRAGGLFDGIRVLDFTAYWAGPYATKWLADFGAEVIKVEPVGRLDLVRTVSNDYTHPRPYDVSAYFNNYARGKKSLAVDPGTAAGRALLLDVAAECDVVIENFKAGRMAKIGLGYDDLRQRRPDIIMVSISGYGQEGPDSGLAGVGTNMEQLSGLASLNVYSDSPQPYNSGIAYGDPISGAMAAATVAMSLMHRNATGEGQYIDISGHESIISMIGEQFAALSRGLAPAPKGNRHPDMAPHGCYPCDGEDRWLTIAVRDDEQWKRLCAVIEREDLAEAYPTLAERRANEYEIDASIMGWSVLQEDAAAAERLQAIGVAAAPVLTPRDQVDDLQLRLRGYFQTVFDPDMGSWPHDGIAWRLGRTPGDIRGPAPRLGQHTREVLATVAGKSPAEIDAAFASGAAGERPGG